MNAYTKYLASPHWKVFRLDAIKHYGNQCNLCSASENLVVHHKHYETLYDEAYEDVEVLCSRCHKLREYNSAFVLVDCEIIFNLKSRPLQAYLILKADAFLNNNSEYSNLTYEAISKIIGCNKNYAVSAIKPLIEKYKLIRREHSKHRNKYYFTHPDEWEF